MESALQAMFYTKGIIMIYGYDSRTVNGYGLKQMREVSLAVPSPVLRDLAIFLQQAADELEIDSSRHWHKHLPSTLATELGCDVVVIPPVLDRASGEKGTDGKAVK